MLFRRRIPASLGERIRILLWPRRSFSRSLRYMGKRIMRITASPHAIAAGLAVGVFSAFTPFFGFHVVIAIVLAYFLAGNLAAAAIGTTFANPLTLPFIWGATYELGRFMINGGSVSNATSLNLGRALETMQFSEIWTPLIKPMLFGSSVLGMAFAVLVYFVTRFAVAGLRRRRLEYLAQRQRDFQAAVDA